MAVMLAWPTVAIDDDRVGQSWQHGEEGVTFERMGDNPAGKTEAKNCRRYYG